ncbi:kinase-like domain-containing protein [Paecilomyces variotii]|uniref:Kinase-like domain-containing protein n=1 Tax=Byssochlamys spectabilis TaxID=264951 RepID=A0A443HXK6_BYSSP|nr:kinase-like domain-containing protein [Paecilomyces variotii]RWQ96568.1 kinase-like domain-containing protein [Paecilomyces variotii]
MIKSFIPSILQPDYTWPRPMPPRILQTTPPVPHVPSKTVRILWGIVHKALYHFSRWYCSWFGIHFDASIVQLPFGLVMKWTDRTSLEEAISMQMARAAGMPVPRLISCGEHPNDPFNAFFSILMTRLPGVPLENSMDELQPDAEEPWLEELKICVQSMRLWHPPSQEIICSPIGTKIRSSRVPHHVMGPFADQEEFHRYLLSPASAHGFKSVAEYEDALLRAKKLQERHYRIVFTHGDFKAHNILVGDDGHLSGFLDWESAGWYPEYWEFTTAMRFGRNSWWFQVASWMGGNQYLDELQSDIALNLLTVDSYIAL